jgi:hypothetical protein
LVTVQNEGRFRQFLGFFFFLVNREIYEH